jgi:predicted Rossmann fold flavoprotein
VPEEKVSHVVIVGGGAAGLMAALSCRKHHPNSKITLLEHQSSLGRKLLVCGAGRCNITNVQVSADDFGGASQVFIDAILEQFSNTQVISFFEELGIPLYEELKNKRGKMFPVTNQAQTVLGLLLDELGRSNIEFGFNVHVDSVSIHHNQLKLEASKVEPKAVKKNKTKSIVGPVPPINQIEFDENGKAAWTPSHIIMANGGKTYPILGADGSGYEIAKKLGHQIIPPVPSALPLLAENDICNKLQGQRLELEVTAIVGGKPVKTARDQVMFTKTGFSGPAILDISRPISEAINRTEQQPCEIKVNFFQYKSRTEVESLLNERWLRRPNQALSVSLMGLMPNKVPAVILEHLNLTDLSVSEISQVDRAKLIDFLIGWRTPIDGTRGWNEGEFTAGGIAEKDINLGTLQSSKIPGLYFAGEIVDVVGDVGGFNLTWAWSSGFVAGQLK